MSSEFICKYCDKVLSSKGSLTRHIKSSKKCITSRDEIIVFKYKCTYCEFSSNLLFDYNNHENICKKRIISLSKQLDLQAQEIQLRKEFESKLLSKKISGGNNNNIIYNMQLNYSKEKLSDYSELRLTNEDYIHDKLTESIYKKGAEGVIRFITRLLKKDNKDYYLCYNKSDVFHRLIDDKIDIDHKANKLLEELLPLIDDKIKDINNNNKNGFDRQREIAIIRSKNYSDNKEKNQQVLITKLQEIDDNEILEQKESYEAIQSIHKLKDISSIERSKCIKQMINTLSISNVAIRTVETMKNSLTSGTGVVQSSLNITESDD